jgi:ribosome-associated toxin RatA of RatAB toxin-antitoxin module
MGSPSLRRATLSSIVLSGVLRGSLAVLVAGAFAAPARADELGDLLAKGPMVRLETDSKGKFRQATCIADVNAEADLVWRVLTDYEQYLFFMPRMEKLEVTREGNDALMDTKLDTPLVATRYTNRMIPDHATKTLTVRQVKGDLSGSHYQWKVVPLSTGRSRIFYSGVVKNFSSVAESFEDDQQTLTIGINVVSLMAATKAIKERAELVSRQAAVPTAAVPTAAVPTAAVPTAAP